MTGYFLGLDWGMAKIGVALADDETRMAFAHSVVKNDKHVFDELRKIVDEYGIETVVIGIPSNYIHTTKLGSEAEKFGKQVQQQCRVRAEFFREMFTTKMAQSNLLESGKRRNLDDQEAARLILQEWLDKR